MTRLSYRLYRIASAVNYRLPRRFTKAGLLALTGMILSGAVGTDLDQSVAFEAFALLFCLLLVALLWTPFFRGEFVVRRALPRLASVGHAFRYRVEVRNRSSHAHRDLEILEELAEPHPSFEEFAQSLHPPRSAKNFRLIPRQGPGLDLRPAVIKPATLGKMNPQGTAETVVEVVPLRRGPLRFKGLTLARCDPLGLIRGFVRIVLPQSVLVLPKRYRLAPLLLEGTRNYQPGGVALASSIGESEEFISLRDYRPGDPFRRLHWRSWARVGRPVVKEYQDEFFARQGLVLDTFASFKQLEAFEEAVSVAASFACTLDTQESLLDLLFAGSQAFTFTSGRSLGQAEQVLEILASIRPHRNGRFEMLHDLVLRHASLLSGCIFVLLSWDSPRQELVRQLRAVGLPVLVIVIAHEAEQTKIRNTMELSADVHLLSPGRIADGLHRVEGAVK